MRANTKSSITLPAQEFRLVKSLKARLRLRSNVEVVLLADRISAERASEMGLVNRVVPRDRVMVEARKLAETICLNGPLAVRACKRSAKESTFLPLKEALANEMTYSASVFMSEDAKEGIRAFKEKRAPVWRGR